MQRKRLIVTMLSAFCLALVSITASAAIVMQMGLADLVGNADKVFRGTVTGREPGTVEAGGSTLDTIRYTIRVDQALKGNFGSGKSAAVIEVEMLGSLKERQATGDVRRLASYEINPDLEVGRSYVLFTTQPSRVGLSTTVGLGQGLFRVFNDSAGREMTANALGNQGLFDGAVEYDALVNAIKSELN